MQKLTISEAVAMIPVSESTLRRDMKRGKVSFDTDEKGRKQFDVSELERVYGPLTDAETANDTHQKPPMTDNDNKVITLLEEQVQDLKAQLSEATTEKQQLLELANRLQKQNEVLMLPAADDASQGWLSRLKRVFQTDP